MNSAELHLDTSTIEQLERVHADDFWRASFASKTRNEKNLPLPSSESTDQIHSWLSAITADIASYSTTFATQQTRSHYDNIFKPFKGSQELVNEFRQLHYLKDGWDGPGSERPGESTIRLAWRLFLNLPFGTAPPELSASADGAISLFWHSNDGFGSATISSAGQLVYFIESKGGIVKDRLDFIGDAIPRELAIALQAI